MKATKIYYKKLFNLGNYEHEEIGIELEAEENESAFELLVKARLFVRVLSTPQAREIEEAYKILATKDVHMNKDVENAGHTIESFDHDRGELPF